MTEQKLTKVEREYLEARQRGIKAALAFDPGHGRPGIRAVREAQQALAERAEEFHKRTLDNMYPERRKIYISRESRYAQHVLFLNEIKKWKQESDWGYPNYIFSGKYGNEPITVVFPDDIGPGPSYQTYRIGNWFFRTEEDLEYPYGGRFKNYSRVAERRVIFGQMRDGQPHTITVTAKSWRGNWLLNALVDAGIGGKSTAPMNVRLHRAYDAELIKEYTIDGKPAKVWRRSLAGKKWDYCLVCGGMTYHDTNPEELQPGWRKKQQEKKNRSGQPVTFAAARDLGFCETGIRQFCVTVGIDPAGTYTAREIKELITEYHGQLDQFAREIRIFRRAFGV